jgi:hypothetical protein
MILYLLILMFYFYKSCFYINFKFTVLCEFWSVLGPTKKGPKTRVLLGPKNSHFFEIFTTFFTFINFFINKFRILCLMYDLRSVSRTTKKAQN